MRKKWLLSLILLTAGCSPQSNENLNLPDDQSTAGKRSRSMTRPRPFKDPPEVLDLASTESIAVKLSAGVEGSPLAPRYSPPGKRLELKPIAVPDKLGVDGLETELVLGWPIDKQKPTKVLVTRPAVGEPYTKLFIDSDGNDVFDEDPIVAKTSESRGSIWSNFSATVQANYLTDAPAAEDYPLALWIAVESKAEQPEFIRISRRGFKTGEVAVGDQKAIIVLSDSNNDAVFGDGDWWELRSEELASKGMGSRNIGDFHWFGDSAYKLVLEDATGNVGRLEKVLLDKTREQDELDRDPYAADRKAAKADKPLEFRNDIDEAIAEAKAKQKRCFIKFETTWCGPCKTMTQHVFTAKEVVDAARDIICIKVDGDERRDLVERYSVKAYPTGILLLDDGSEASRFVGYQKVVDMSKFLLQTTK